MELVGGFAMLILLRQLPTLHGPQILYLVFTLALQNGSTQGQA